MHPFFRAGGFLVAMLFAFGLTAICYGTAQAESRYKRKSREHKEACELWCKENPNKCDFCSTKSGCGKNATKVMSYGGYGKNWYACKKTESRKEAGARHKASCEKWCTENKLECKYCSRLSDCGNPKHHKIKSWKGRGKNYYACAKKLSRKELGQLHREACEKWCKENPDKCDHCRSTATCGSKWKKVMTFGGKGKNWYACKRNK
jgi:hypothetical protein